MHACKHVLHQKKAEVVSCFTAFCSYESDLLFFLSLLVNSEL